MEFSLPDHTSGTQTNTMYECVRGEPLTLCSCLIVTFELDTIYTMASHLIVNFDLFDNGVSSHGNLWTMWPRYNLHNNGVSMAWRRRILLELTRPHYLSCANHAPMVRIWPGQSYNIKAANSQVSCIYPLFFFSQAQDALSNMISWNRELVII